MSMIIIQCWKIINKYFEDQKMMMKCESKRSEADKNM